MKYTNTRVANTKACKKPTANSYASTIIGKMTGDFNKASLADIISPNNTIPAKMFPNNLSDKDNALDTSPMISIIPTNSQTTISPILAIAVGILVTFGTKPRPLYPIYFWTKCMPLVLYPYTSVHMIIPHASTRLNVMSVDAGLK